MMDKFYQSYELHELLGHGAYTTVRRVTHRLTNQVYAAKIYESAFLKAKMEIDLLIKLDHPSIVNIYEVFEENQVIILILEYMGGGELYQCVCQQKVMTESDVRHFMRALVDAVRYCHEMGVIHRDIKNLLLTSTMPDKILKLSDFGISKILSDQKLSSICGTPIYMAPQIWMLQAYDEKADIWSIGVVMYFLLSGDLPFKGDNTKDLIDHINQEEADFKGSVWSNVSARAIIMIRNMLMKNPEDRMSAQALTQHIWFNDSHPLYKQITEIQTSLDSALHKVNKHCTFSKIESKKKGFQYLLSSKKKIVKQRVKFLTKKSATVEESAGAASCMITYK